MLTGNNVWDIFDAITCINVKDRSDRLYRVKKRFEEVGLKHKVTFYFAERSIHGGTFGCCESHYNIIKQYYKNNIKYGVIFEDDVVFNPGWLYVLNDATQFLKSSETDFDVFYFGCNIRYLIDANHLNPNIYNAKMSMTHAYVISRQGMEKFLNGIHLEEFKNDQTWGHDIVLNNIFDKMYCHINNFAIYQELKDSDIEWSLFEFIPPKHTELLQWCRCTFNMKFRPQTNFLAKLAHYIPFNYRPYFDLPTPFQIVIKKKSHSSQRCVLRNVFGHKLMYIWMFWTYFFASPTKTLSVATYLVLFRLSGFVKQNIFYLVYNVLLIFTIFGLFCVLI